jgi:hypothetical protein
MATHIPNPVIHLFKEVNEGKYKSVRHYDLVSVRNGKTQLSEKVNLSKDRKFAQSMPDYWLKKKEGKTWGKCITGLFRTNRNNVFKGDSERKKNLIVIKFSNDAKEINIYFFKDFYTRNLSDVTQFLTT